MARRSRAPLFSPRSVRLTMVSAVAVIGGLVFLLSGMAGLLQPEWFYENLAPFGPYNRLGIGLAGSLLLPLGVVTIIGSQSPASSRLVLGMAASAAVLMVLNAWYGAATGEFRTAEHSLLITAMIGLALGLMWAFFQVRPRLRRR